MVMLSNFLQKIAKSLSNKKEIQIEDAKLNETKMRYLNPYLVAPFMIEINK